MLSAPIRKPFTSRRTSDLLHDEEQRSNDGFVQPTTVHEQQLRQFGFSVIAGLDEAGRGPLAGPVVAAAVVLPEGYVLDGIRDSKLLTPGARERLYEAFVNDVSFAVGIKDAAAIDASNILNATHAAMREAVERLVPAPEYVLVDGLPVKNASFAHTALTKGDRISLSIAAASIIAKVTRDRMMDAIDRKYPEYGFSRHKGYATRQHLLALNKYGPCVEHRFSFATVRAACLPIHRQLLQERLANRQCNLRMDL